MPHASSGHLIFDNALALLALPFRPVTAVVLLPASHQKGGLYVMPGAHESLRRGEFDPTEIKLSSDYHIYNQIKPPCRSSCACYQEPDYIVVGSNGVFIIENKDY